MSRFKLGSWKINSKQQYRIFIRNDETLQEIFSLRLNFIAIYGFVATVFVILFAFIWLLIAYTPLKRWMPGYDDIYIHPEYVKLSKKVDEVEAAYNEQLYYIESFRQILLGTASENSEVTPLNSINNDKSQLFKTEEISESDTAKPLISISNVSSVQNNQTESAGFITLKAENTPSANQSIKQIYLIPPVKGVIIQAFDPVKRHYGIDLSAPQNTPVKAILGGRVLSAEWNLDTGNTVCILHDNNIVTFYKHNAANLVTAGTYVSAGEAVAIIGNTGTKTTGPHLHFELWIDGSPVNPVEYINF
jgi:murein DD-endopeptidase MepM/ murein hydrolase activator NlpD